MFIGAFTGALPIHLPSGLLVIKRGHGKYMKIRYLLFSSVFSYWNANFQWISNCHVWLLEGIQKLSKNSTWLTGSTQLWVDEVENYRLEYEADPIAASVEFHQQSGWFIGISQAIFVYFLWIYKMIKSGDLTNKKAA